MQGVTTAIVAFIFLCLAMPSLVKNKNQYYIALIATIGVIFLDAVAHMFPSAPALHAVLYVLAGFAQIIAIAMLILSTGGLTARELGGDMFEVLRRGETEKEIIIPLSEEAKKKIQAGQAEIARRQAEAARRAARDEKEPEIFKIDDPAGQAPPAPPAAKGGVAGRDVSGPLPLE